ncbi:hypothetical protein [Acidithrix ferrooxidans]|uniref:SCP domain-containing protein n=1 Tax=Acidithrix ferrooxidans TaxID=1280514 RepID=A0A0D8HIB8_9ACTN|nr:hypothetical protein [Acidithrix ferrooxidans]KJF17668.1 hypothetical protein AXFE_14630 [Acidithrix ferrooxidans]
MRALKKPILGASLLLGAASIVNPPSLPQNTNYLSAGEQISSTTHVAYRPSSNSYSNAVVGVAPTPGRNGYWAVESNGTLKTYGSALGYGSLAGTKLNQPIVGIAATPDGKGYWLVAADGGIFTFGDAGFYGSTGAIKLNQPIVGMAATPDGKGYWLVAADGGIFTFGDAGFYGTASAGKALIASKDGKGYLILDDQGSPTSLGDAKVIAGAPVVFGSPTTPTPTTNPRLLLPPKNPTGNIAASPNFATTCWQSPNSGACQNLEVAALDSARLNSEGLAPFTLPSNFATLNPAEQTLVIIDIERGSRGLPIFVGLVNQLNVDASRGAAMATDPNYAMETIPGVTGYYGYGSIWAEDYSALAADYDWMYNDGLGSGNLDCTANNTSGCWGHRDNILHSAPGYQLIMGAGYQAMNGMVSLAQIFIAIPQNDVIPASDYSYTWSQAVAAGASF